jgi:hypothetical protein
LSVPAKIERRTANERRYLQPFGEGLRIFHRFQRPDVRSRRKLTIATVPEFVAWHPHRKRVDPFKSASAYALFMASSASIWNSRRASAGGYRCIDSVAEARQHNVRTRPKKRLKKVRKCYLIPLFITTNVSSLVGDVQRHLPGVRNVVTGLFA